jgi:hypothetical protein
MLFVAFHGFVFRFITNSQGGPNHKTERKKIAEISRAFQKTLEALRRSRVAGHAITIKMKNEEEMQTQQWTLASFAAQFQDLPKTDG